MSSAFYSRAAFFLPLPPTFSYKKCEANDDSDKTEHYNTQIICYKKIRHISFKINTQKLHVTELLFEWQHFSYS